MAGTGGFTPARGQSVIGVPAGGNLQAALNAARPGDTIVLQAGATYVGNFILPAKGGGEFITLRSSADGSLPGEGTRIGPGHAPLLAKLRSPNTMPAIATAPGAHHYRLLLLEFLANAGGAGNVIALGDGSDNQRSLAAVPQHLVLDRVYIHGDPVAGQKRAVALNSGATTITNSYIADIKSADQDSQAIGGWNGPGPYLITNNYLEAAGENVMFGGSDPAIPNLVPSDITLRHNHFTKPLAWRGQRWLVKNLFELKNAQRVTVEGNIFEHNWEAAQSGYAILLKSVNQGGAAPWSVVQHVRFVGNIVRHVSSAINILGRDRTHAAVEANNITFRNNLFEHVSGGRYGGAGRFLLVNGGTQITFDHNTVFSEGPTTVYGDGAPSYGFVFTNNVLLDRGGALRGSGSGAGNGTLAKYFPGGVFAGNIIVGANPAAYPAANWYPPSMAAVGFRHPSGGGCGLSPSSPYGTAATDGTAPGCHLDTGGGGYDPGFVPAPHPPAAGTPPRDIRAVTNGSSLTITWEAPPSGASAYVLEAGSAPGATNLASVNTGNSRTSLTAPSVPAGVYYLRVRAVTSLGVSAPSEEIRVSVGAAADCRPPAAPTSLRATTQGLTVALTWTGPGGACAPTHYVVHAGSAAGRSNLAQAAVATPALAARAAAGTYFVRVVAVNAAGTSAPSNEVVVTLRP